MHIQKTNYGCWVPDVHQNEVYRVLKTGKASLRECLRVMSLWFHWPYVSTGDVWVCGIKQACVFGLAALLRFVVEGQYLYKFISRSLQVSIRSN